MYMLQWSQMQRRQQQYSRLKGPTCANKMFLTPLHHQQLQHKSKLFRQGKFSQFCLNSPESPFWCSVGIQQVFLAMLKCLNVIGSYVFGQLDICLNDQLIGAPNKVFGKSKHNIKQGNNTYNSTGLSRVVYFSSLLGSWELARTYCKLQLPLPVINNSGFTPLAQKTWRS